VDYFSGGIPQPVLPDATKAGFELRVTGFGKAIHDCFAIAAFLS
jgi:hypothetical protein